jgi:hypothetical protein|tara:strand:- start:1434 stop:3356 length:1923 start_codon:yes stop_codon:yes gene_type:complete
MGRIYLDEDVSADGQTLILDANKNADYQTLIEEKFFRQMLAYPFSWISNRKSNSKLDMIQGRMGGLLTYTQEEFDREPDNEGYEFDEQDFKDYQRKFLDTMEKQLIDEIVKDLKRENLLPDDILSTSILGKMKEMGFILSDLDNNNKLQRTMKGKKTAEGFKEGLPFGAMDDDTTGGFIGAFLDSRPILYEEIKDHIEVKDNQITFDTEKYIEQISVAEGYGKLEKEDSKLTIASPKSGEVDETVEIFSIDKTNDGRYRMEGFGKTRLIDDVEETWDVYQNLLSLKNLEKYIEKVILSQKQSPLKNVLLSLVEPEDRMLNVGKLDIFVDNLSAGDLKNVGFGLNNPLTKETWMKYVRSLEGKAVEGSKKIGVIEELMMYAFNLFSRDRPFSDLDDSKQLEKVRGLKDSKKNEILDDLTSEQLYDIWEDNGKPTGADLDKIDDLANALYNQAMGKDMVGEVRKAEDSTQRPIPEGVQRRIEEMVEEQTENMKDTTDEEKKKKEEAKAKARQKLNLDFRTGKFPRKNPLRNTLGPVGGSGKQSGGGDVYPVLDAGKKRRGMIRLRVNFRPTKLVSARDYEIYQKRVDEKGKPMKDLGRRPLGGEGPRTAVELDRQKMQDTEKDFKSIMELKLGYNRLKGLVG